jgi:eukaryotic-like serine/threonine-protein kinase
MNRPIERDPIETPRLIGARYRLGDVIGRSLMSEVRRGEDLRLERAVAIKLLRGDGDTRSVARFEREAQILASLHHPNIVVVFDTGVDGGDRFIVMEFIEGPTLRDLLDNYGPLSLERASDITSKLASALGFAHERGIVHRDIKPSNVMLPHDGGVKLVDMGIARLLSQEALTLTLTVLGTARYLSPENARGDRLDGRSDVYSLGCVLFEMLTGRTPFEGSPMALSFAHVNTAAPRVRSINPDVPAAMDELVASMLEKDPAHRPQTGQAVQGLLVSATKHEALVPTAVLMPAEPTTAFIARRPADGRRKSGPKAWPMAVIAVCGLAVLLLVALLAGGAPESRTNASRPSPPLSSSPAMQQPSRLETNSPHVSDSPAVQEPSPVETTSPVPETPSEPSPEEAAAVVLTTVGEGIETGEVTGHIDHDIRHAIDEILRETDKGEEIDHSLEEIDKLLEKVSEALEKGEITSASRASAISDALLGFADALREAEQSTD